MLLVLILITRVSIVKAQPSVDTLNPTDVTDTSAILNGSINPNGLGTTWFFKYFGGNDQLASDWQKCAPAGNHLNGGNVAVPVSCALSGLLPDKTYTFQLNATNDNGESARGVWISFTTLLNLTLPISTTTVSLGVGPRAETDPATGVGDTFAILNGVVTTNGNDTEWVFTVIANGKPVQDCPDNSVYRGFTPAAAGQQAVTCQRISLQPNTTYSFFLTVCWGPPGSFNLGGSCANGSVLTFTTHPDCYSVVSPQINSLEQTFDKTKGLLLAETAPEYLNATALYGPLQPENGGQPGTDAHWNVTTCQLVYVWFIYAFPLPNQRGTLEIFVNPQATEITYVHTYPYATSIPAQATTTICIIPPTMASYSSQCEPITTTVGGFGYGSGYNPYVVMMTILVAMLLVYIVIRKHITSVKTPR